MIRESVGEPVNDDAHARRAGRTAVDHERWRSRLGLILLGDAAHLMFPFGGEGVNLALADAADLADALTANDGWQPVTAYEAAMAARAEPAAEGATEGLNSAISAQGAAHVLDHYRERVAT